MANINGDNGDNILVGTADADLIQGGNGADQLSGLAGNDELRGQNGDDILDGGIGDDRLLGGDGADQLIGDAGNDLLSGGLGADAMLGGTGNDAYVVENVGDTVVELVGEGVDFVVAHISFTLGANVENMVLAGVASLNGNGNGLANVITGNAGANILIGGAGNDTLSGLAGADDLRGQDGDDILLGGDGDDLIVGANGADVMHGEAGADRISGGAGIDTLTGGAGDDVLNGGVGADIMIGGIGDDAYIVDDLGDTVIEAVGEGVDRVISSISVTLADNVEILALSGVSDIDGTGNDLDNIVSGNAGANVLDGGLGADVLRGLAGDDTYLVDNIGDVVIELAGQGDDRMIATVSTTIAANVETLELADAGGAIDGTGNTAANSLIGNSSANVLAGAGGADAIDGAAGDDVIGVSDVGFASIDGGADEDILRLDAPGLTLDLTARAGDIANLEAVDMRSAANSVVTIDADDIPLLSGGTEFFILGGADATLNAGADWTAAGQALRTVGAVTSTFDIFTKNGFTLLVEATVGTVNLVVIDPNTAPTLAPGATAATEDGPAVVFDLSTIGDDADADDDGATLTYSIVTQPGEGSASISGTDLSFDPGAAFQDLAVGETRDVTVTVQAQDQHGADSGTADITVTVTGTNDAPTVVAGVLAADEDGAAAVFDLSTIGDDIDSDDDGASLNYSIVTAISEASATISGASLSFDPGAAFQDLAVGETRDVTITVQAQDQHGADSGTADITVTVTGVNDAPTVDAGVLAADEDGAAVVFDLSTIGDDIDSDDDGASLTYSIVTQPGEGSASISGTELSFDPGAAFQDLAAGETRDVTVTVQAQDQHGADSGTADITVTVTGANDAPTVDLDGNTGGADFATRATSDGVTIGVVDATAVIEDIDSGQDLIGMTVTLTDGPNLIEGLTLSPAGGVIAGGLGIGVIGAGIGAGTLTFIGAGTPAEYTALLQEVQYTLDELTFELDPTTRVVEVVVTDASGADSNTATASIIIDARVSDTTDLNAFTGAEGDDIVNGLTGNDVLNGGDGDDQLFGGADEDDLTGGEGDDALDGGTGANTANFAGDFADFTLSFSGGQLTVADDNAADGDEGVDTIANIGTLEFGDGTTAHVVDGGGSGGFTTISAAVAAASAGDVILVAPGTYVENVVIDKTVTLLSFGGASVTTIQGVSGQAALGTIEVDTGVNDVRIGDIDNGFTIVGINGNGAIEKAAIYLQGSQDGLIVQGNDVVANGDAGLTSEFGGALTNALIDSNTFSGQTFEGAEPSGNGFATQFDAGNNVPRQFVVIGEGNGPFVSGNITFSNNAITGLAGVASTTDSPVNGQGNTMVTIDVDGATISDNTFTGTTARFATALRARGPNTDIVDNTFDNDSAGGDTRGVFAAGPNASGADSGNVFTGGTGDDLFFGSRGDDAMTGGAGDDSLQGGGGDDALDGGDDTDTAAFADVVSAYTIGVTTDANGFVTGFTSVTDDNAANGDEGVDTLTSIEALQFDDTALDLADPVQLFDSNGDLAGTFDTLLAAVDAAGADATIRVGAGAVSGGASQIVIDQNLTIIGAGADETTILGGFDTVNNGDPRGWFLVNDGVTLDVSNIGFDGNGFKIAQAFRHKGSGTFDNVAFEDIQFNSSGPDYAGVAIAAFGPTSDVDVTNSSFAEIGRIGVLYFGAGVTGTFEGNTYTGKGVGDHLDYTLDISAGATIEVTNNTVSGNFGVAASDGSASAGFLVTTFFAGGTTATFTGNAVNDSSNGVFVGFNAADASTVTFGAGNTFDNGTAEAMTGVVVVGDGVVSGVDGISGNAADVDWNGGNAANAIAGAALGDELSGGDGDDTIDGGAGDDVIDGGAGADTLSGGLGDDLYLADAADTIVEAADEGTDEVRSSESITLSDNVENLTLLDPDGAITEDFEDFDLGPVADGENGWAFDGNLRDQNVIVDPNDAGNQVFRMSSDPSTGDFAGPYSPSLANVAGEPQTSATRDAMEVSFSIQAVDPTGTDNSRLEIDFGNKTSSDRVNFMVVENTGGGIRISTAEALPGGDFQTGDTLNDFSAFTGNTEHVSGVDASIAHELTMRVEFNDGPNNDVVKLYLDGQFIGQSNTFENFFDAAAPGNTRTHAENAEINQAANLFFRATAGSAAGDNDGPGGVNQGFMFDNITYNSFTAAGADGTGDGLANTILGNSSNNTLTGLGGDDVLTGGSGDDVLVGGEGSDTLSGGLGFDVAQFSGNAADFTVDFAAGTVTDNNAGDGDEGADAVSGVERLDFADSSVLFVGGGSEFLTIQAAVDAANAGDTIIVADGTFAEDVRIEKQLTILGANAGVSGSDGGRGAESALTGGFSILAGGAGTTIDGFAVSEGVSGIVGFGADTVAFAVQADGVTITNNVITRSGTVDTDGSRGIINATGSSDGLTVTDNVASGWHTGTFLNPGTNGTVTGNTFDGNAVGLSNDGADAASIADNTFSNNVLEDIGIGAFSTPTDLSFIATSNTFTDGIPDVSIFPLLNADGQVIDGSDNDDTFNGDQTASSFGQIVDGKGGDDVLNAGGGDDDLTGGAGDDAIDGGAGVDTVRYTGDQADYTLSDPVGLVTTVTDGTAARDGADTVENVEVLDFADADILFVGNGSAFATIQSAVDAASAGDTIIVAAGDYTENVSIDKALTIIGAGSDGTGSNITPATGNAFTVTVNDAAAAVTISGFRMDGGGTAQNGVVADGDSATLLSLTIEDSHIFDFMSNGVAVSDFDDTRTILTTIENSTFATNGGNAGGGDGDIQFFQYQGDATLKDLTITGGRPTGASNDPRTGIQFRDDVSSAGGDETLETNNPLGTVSLDNVTVDGAYRNQAIIFTRYSDIDGLTMKDVTVNADSLTFNTSINFSDLGGTIDLSDTAKFDNVTVPGAALPPIADVVSLQGDELANTLTAGSDDTFIRGDEGSAFGDDILTGGSGDDFIAGDNRGLGGDGDTTVGGADDILGGDGDDQLFGDGGDDTLDGEAGNDSVFGESGDDQIGYTVGEGVDVISGGDDTDTLTTTGTALADVIDATVVGATIEMEINASGIADVTVDTVENFVFDLGDGADRLDLAGNLAAAGVATVAVDGGADADIFDASNVTSATGMAFDGGAGDDQLRGGAGDDTLVGGLGDDILDGGTGSDTADYSADVAGILANISAVNGFTFGAGIGSDQLFNIDNILGGAGADLITGSSGSNVLSGGGGADVINGLGGSDSINAGAGADLLTGGAADGVTDMLNGGGADLAVDTFVFSGLFGNDVIVDFEDGFDHIEIDLGSYSPGVIVTSLTSGANHVISINDGLDAATITIIGAAGQIDGSDFTLIPA